MPTTLAIADDVFAEAQAIAERQHRPIADVISDMARYGLQHAPLIEEINGIPVIISKPGSRQLTLDMVNALRDDEP